MAILPLRKRRGAAGVRTPRQRTPLMPGRGLDVSAKGGMAGRAGGSPFGARRPMGVGGYRAFIPPSSDYARSMAYSYGVSGGSSGIRGSLTGSVMPTMMRYGAMPPVQAPIAAPIAAPAQQLQRRPQRIIKRTIRIRTGLSEKAKKRPKFRGWQLVTGSRK